MRMYRALKPHNEPDRALSPILVDIMRKISLELILIEEGAASNQVDVFPDAGVRISLTDSQLQMSTHLKSVALKRELLRAAAIGVHVHLHASRRNGSESGDSHECLHLG